MPDVFHGARSRADFADERRAGGGNPCRGIAAAPLARWCSPAARGSDVKSPMIHRRTLGRQVPERGSGASGKRFLALCLMAVTLVLLGIPDEADLQPVMVGGLQSFSDGE